MISRVICINGDYFNYNGKYERKVKKPQSSNLCLHIGDTIPEKGLNNSLTLYLLDTNTTKVGKGKYETKHYFIFVEPVTKRLAIIPKEDNSLYDMSNFVVEWNKELPELTDSFGITICVNENDGYYYDCKSIAKVDMHNQLLNIPGSLIMRIVEDDKFQWLFRGRNSQVAVSEGKLPYCYSSSKVIAESMANLIWRA